MALVGVAGYLNKRDYEKAHFDFCQSACMGLKVDALAKAKSIDDEFMLDVLNTGHYGICEGKTSDELLHDGRILRAYLKNK